MLAAVPSPSDLASAASSSAGDDDTDTQPIADRALGGCVLRAIEDLTHQTGRPPTYRELLASTGIRSHQRLSACLDELVRTGRLRRLAGSRNLIVMPRPTTAGTD
jgi:hypothetical protein